MTIPIKNQEKVLQNILIDKIRITDLEYVIDNGIIFLSEYYYNKLQDYYVYATDFERLVIDRIVLKEGF
jgi:hypothetical protein